jgi:hypothetical protein
MVKLQLTAEQAEQLENRAAVIGHNLGPSLDERASEIQGKVAQHHELKHLATEIRVMFDMMRSHISGERLLSKTTSAYVFGGVALVAAMTTVGIVVEPIPTLLLDAVVVGFTAAALHGDMQEYADWRAARDPSYQEIRRALASGAG